MSIFHIALVVFLFAIALVYFGVGFSALSIIVAIAALIAGIALITGK